LDFVSPGAILATFGVYTAQTDVSRLIIVFMIRTWKITKNKHEEIAFSERSSFDVITRQLPEGYYSTFRTYDGGTRVLGLTSHLKRLPNIDASSLRRHMKHLLEPYRPGEARVRVMQTGRGQVYIAIEPLKLLPSEVYQQGVRVETVEIKRESPRLKATAFIGQSESARRHLTQTNIFEALLIKNKKILEGMTSNFFFLFRTQRGVLHTAQHDVLLGVTRRNVIRVARGQGLEIRYVPLKVSQVSAINEAFITSSSRGIVPVIQIDDVIVGEGCPGEVTKQLMVAYDKNVLKMAEKV
jgi:branched-chain amino acid aminotransferase